MLYAGLSARPAPVSDGVLGMDLDGAWSSSRRGAQWPTSPAVARTSEYRLRDLVAALDEAKDDNRVKAVALDLDGFLGGGQTAIGDLAEAIPGARSRQAGDRLSRPATPTTATSWPLSVGNLDEPAGAMPIAGPGGKNLYFKGLLDKLGVTANVYRVGTYKSAVEPFIAQRHVARSAREMPRRSARRCSKPGARTSSRPGPRRTSTCSCTT